MRDMIEVLEERHKGKTRYLNEILTEIEDCKKEITKREREIKNGKELAEEIHADMEKMREAIEALEKNEN